MARLNSLFPDGNIDSVCIQLRISYQLYKVVNAGFHGNFFEALEVEIYDNDFCRMRCKPFKNVTQEIVKTLARNKRMLVENPIP